VLLEHPEYEEDARPYERMLEDACVTLAAPLAAGDREGQRDADDEEEEREDPGRGRGAMARHVLEELVALARVALLVHEQNSGDGEAAEHVERVQPGRQRRQGSGGHDSG